MHALRRLKITLPAALAVSAALAATALAEPNRTVTFSSSQTSTAWEGSGAFGATPGGVYQCGTGYNCDDTLFDIKDLGTLKASGELSDENFLGSMDLYKASADGAPEGDPVA